MPIRPSQILKEIDFSLLLSMIDEIIIVVLFIVSSKYNSRIKFVVPPNHV